MSYEETLQRIRSCNEKELTDLINDFQEINIKEVKKDILPAIYVNQILIMESLKRLLNK